MTVYRPHDGGNGWETLTDDEIDYACRTAMKMRELSIGRGHKDHRAEGTKEYDESVALRIQALGALGELVARKFLGYPMKLVTENFSKADLPDNIEVRLIGNNSYGLRIYPRTDDSRRVVGVVIEPGRERSPPWRIPGWIVAEDGKQERWSMSPCGRPPMYAVPQEHLRPVSELKNLVQSRDRRK